MIEQFASTRLEDRMELDTPKQERSAETLHH